MPYARGFIWPKVTMHNRLASHFLKQIPADASVSTQTALVPHLSQRQSIYLFPYAIGHADYILLDASGYTYPFKDYKDYAATVKTILQHGDYGVVDMEDRYLLLKRGYPPSDITPALQMIDEDAYELNNLASIYQSGERLDWLIMENTVAKADVDLNLA